MHMKESPSNIHHMKKNNRKQKANKRIRYLDHVHDDIFIS